MTPYDKMYYRLFNKVTEALEELEGAENSPGTERAIHLLQAAQLLGEELYIEAHIQPEQTPPLP